MEKSDNKVTAQQKKMKHIHLDKKGRGKREGKKI